MSDFPMMLAAKIGVTRRTLTRLCAAGKIPGAYRTKGGHWRLRKPRRIEWSGRYDDRIIEFVVHCTSVPGQPVSARQARGWNKIAQWVDEFGLTPATASMLRAVILRGADGEPTIDWQCVAEMEKLIDSRDFNNAVELSLVLAGISDDDRLPKGIKNVPLREKGRVIRQHFEDLKNRDPKKYDLLSQPDIANLRHPRAGELAKKHDGILMVKAVKLILNRCEVTPNTLAQELKISPSTLYRRYGQEAVNRACRLARVSDLKSIYQTPEQSRRAVEEAIADRIDKKDSEARLDG